MQCTIRQRRHLECNSLRHAEPMKADERVGDVVTTSQVDKKLSYHRGSTRCVVSVEILPIATQQCRNYLYDKS